MAVDWLVVFCGISTLDGYLMPNPVYTYISNTYDLSMNGFVGNNFYMSQSLFVCMVKWFQVLLSKTNSSIYYT